MRVLLTTSSKKKVYQELKKKYKCNSIKQLSIKLKIPAKTLDTWFYNQSRFIPCKFLLNNRINGLKIIEKKENNWGQSLGGKNSYFKTINEKGVDEIKRRQSFGGKRAAQTKERIEKEKFNIDFKDADFLEFYGALIGDGWINSLNSPNKWQIGICGHLSLDKIYVLKIQDKVKKLFNRRGYIYHDVKGNTIYFLFRHKLLVNYMKDELKFPLGKKTNLQIHKKIYKLDFKSLKNVIRGIFDTDGCFCLTKRPNGRKEPRISVHMNSPVLIKQIGDTLMQNGFKVNYCNDGKMLRLQGRKQLRNWMEKIGSSNSKHLNKIENFFKTTE